MENHLKESLVEIASRYVDNSKEINDMVSELMALPTFVIWMELVETLEGIKKALKRTLDQYNPDDIEYEWIGNAHEALLKAKADAVHESPELLEACKFALTAFEKMVPSMQPDSQVLEFIQQAIHRAERKI